MHEDVPGEVTGSMTFPDEEDPHTKIEFIKMKFLSNIIHTLSLQKI